MAKFVSSSKFSFIRLLIDMLYIELGTSLHVEYFRGEVTCNEVGVAETERLSNE